MTANQMSIFDMMYEPKVYKLEQVSVRLVKEKTLKYNEPIVNSKDAIKTIQDFLGDLDREAFVVLCLNTTLFKIF